MRQMIDLRFKDICEGCKVADLKLICIDGSENTVFWRVECRHENACNEMEWKTRVRIKHEKEDMQV